MASEFDIIFRRDKRVEVLIPYINTVDSYNLETALLPITGPWTVRMSIQNVPEGPSSGAFKNKVFARFNADSFVAGLDDKTFYVRLVPVTGGVPGTPGPIKAVGIATDANLPPEVIRETAPLVATKIPFSRTTASLSIINLDGTNSIFVSFEPGGTEISLPTQTDEFNDRGNFDAIYVRGSPAVCTFQVVAILSSGDAVIR